MKKYFEKNFKKIIPSLVIVSLLLVSCAPYKSEDVLFEYKDYNVLYYLKTEMKKYKYSDYIVDDVSNGKYKASTPNITDYKLGPGLLDYDIPAYTKARLDYFYKIENIKNHEYAVDSMCASVHDDYFEQKNSYVHYYDLNTKKDKLLSDKPVTNITYDDEMPMITFDVEPDVEDEQKKMIKGRKIMLSDIIAAGYTIEGYMKVYLGTGMEKHKFFLDREQFDIATSSEISIK